MPYACQLSLKLVYYDELFSQQFPYANFEKCIMKIIKDYTYITIHYKPSWFTLNALIITTRNSDRHIALFGIPMFYN